MQYFYSDTAALPLFSADAFGDSWSHFSLTAPSEARGIWLCHKAADMLVPWQGGATPCCGQSARDRLYYSQAEMALKYKSRHFSHIYGIAAIAMADVIFVDNRQSYISALSKVDIEVL
jgi:hypothetical protein